MKEIICLGIDPGLANTGYAVVSFCNGQFKLIKGNMIKTNKDHCDALRLRFILKCCMTLVDKYEPDYCAAEKFFAAVRVNPKTKKPVFDANVQKLNQVIGVILAACAMNKVEQYSPGTVKKCVGGHGRADKKGVQIGSEKILCLPEILKPDHVADAAAHAIIRIMNTPEYAQWEDQQNGIVF